jgi:hypothetical protein
MQPLREIMMANPDSYMDLLKSTPIRDVAFPDFEPAFRDVNKTVSPDRLQFLEDWNDKFGAKV